MNHEKIIQRLSGKHRFLSNFYPTPVTLDGIIYPTVEHAYQASKSLDQKYRESIKNCITPGEAKMLGEATTLRSDWEKVKVGIMLSLVTEKFTQNKILNKLLIDTGNMILVEGNYWHDNYWGKCGCPECKKKIGLNKLGKILMMIRNLIGIEYYL